MQTSHLIRAELEYGSMLDHKIYWDVKPKKFPSKNAINSAFQLKEVLVSKSFMKVKKLQPNFGLSSR